MGMIRQDVRWIKRLVSLGWIFSLTMMTFAACPGRSGERSPQDPSGKTVTISGRVVDFESCFSNGCKGVEGMQVALFYDPSIISKPTSSNGVFTLNGVPSGVRTNLFITDASGSDRYLPTLQGNFTTTRGKSIYTLETYAVSREKALYRSIKSELYARVERSGIYVGLVLSDKSQNLQPVTGAKVLVSPEASIRYYKADLDKEPASKEAFFPATKSSTANNGLFVAVAKPDQDDYSVIVSGSSEMKESFTPIYASVGKGYVTLGIHYSTGTSPK